MKRYAIILFVGIFLAMSATNVLAWKEKYDEDFKLGDTGSSVKVGSVVTGGIFFQPPNVVNFVASSQPGREDVSVTQSKTENKFDYREGKCPDARQTRSVGNGASITTTTTTTVVKTAPKAEVVHASSHMGRAPLETIVPAVAGIAQDAVGGYFFKEGMRVLRPDNFSNNTTQTGAGSGPVNAYGGDANSKVIDSGNSRVDFKNKPKFDVKGEKPNPGTGHGDVCNVKGDDRRGHQGGEKKVNYHPNNNHARDIHNGDVEMGGNLAGKVNYHPNNNHARDIHNGDVEMGGSKDKGYKKY